MKATVRLFLCTVLFCQSLSAQMQPSAEVLEKASNLQENKKFREAIELYQTISPADSNYFQALYSLSNCYYADSQKNEALKYCMDGVEKHNDYHHMFLNLEANILDDMDRKQDAVRVYRECIQRYPSYVHPYTNLALTYMILERPDSAESVMKAALMAHPYSSIAHYRLGMAALKQGKLAQAYLSLGTAVLVAPDASISRNALELMNKLANGNEELLSPMNNRTYAPDANYEAVEQLFVSRAALDKGYKTGSKLEEALLKQLYMISDKLEFQENSNDFWIQYYLPLYKQILRKEQSDEWFYHMLSGLEVKEIDGWVAGHKKDVQRFKTDCANYLEPIRTTRQIKAANRTEQNVRYYYQSEVLLATGEFVNGKKTGNWEAYYNQGNLKAKGPYGANDQRDGNWTFYHANGRISSKEVYRADEVEGEASFYSEDGSLNRVSVYRNGKKNGPETEYYPSGQIKTRTAYIDDKENGAYTGYFPSGNIKLELKAVNGNAEGVFKRYHPNGRLESTGQLRDGKQEGIFRFYHENGALKTEGTMSNDQKQGVWKSYYDNGVLSSVTNYENGKMMGEHAEYHDNKQLQYKEILDKNGTVGEVTFYDRDGKMFSIFKYQNSILKKASYYDKSGKLLGESTASGKEMNLEYFHPDGTRRKTAHYDAKGRNDGKETTFYGSGNINNESLYKDGELVGKGTTWYNSGRKKFEANYVGGVRQGPYVSYHPNGVKESEGLLMENERYGQWQQYDEDGNLIRTDNYTADMLDGYRQTYYPNGNREMVFLYKEDMLDSLAQYDSTGKLLKTQKLVNGKGQLEILQANGKRFSLGTYLNGVNHGLYESFMPNGKLLSREYFYHGMADSTYTLYTPEGKVQREGKFDKGDKTGTWKYYTTDGILYMTEEYKHGKLEGLRTYYYENGKPEMETPFYNGTREGWVKRYAENGDLMYLMHAYDDEIMEYSYHDAQGKPVPAIPLKGGNGKLKAFYSNGKPSAEFDIIGSEVNGTVRYWSPSGHLTYESPETFDLTHGEQKEWYPDGKIRRIAQFKHNSLEGKMTNYHANGRVRSEGEYHLDSQHGSWKFYDANGKLTREEIYYHGRLLEIR